MRVCLCDCVVCVVIWLVFTAGCFAVRQLILARRALTYGDGPELGVGKLTTARRSLFLLQLYVFVP